MQASSYNTNGKKPPAGLDVGAWLGLWAGDWPPGANDVAEDAKDLPDIVCVGFQEIVPLNAGNVMIGGCSYSMIKHCFAVASMHAVQRSPPFWSMLALGC